MLYRHCEEAVLIVQKAEFLEILARQEPDRMGFFHPTELDATKLVVYAHKLLAVQAQAQKLFWESDAATDTPAQAALALALHEADPKAFNFPPCLCGSYPMTACPPSGCCDRRAWVMDCRAMARAPQRRRRPWWQFWGRRWP